MHYLKGPVSLLHTITLLNNTMFQRRKFSGVGKAASARLIWPPPAQRESYINILNNSREKNGGVTECPRVRQSIIYSIYFTNWNYFIYIISAHFFTLIHFFPVCAPLSLFSTLLEINFTKYLFSAKKEEQVLQRQAECYCHSFNLRPFVTHF